MSCSSTVCVCVFVEFAVINIYLIKFANSHMLYHDNNCYFNYTLIMVIYAQQGLL